MGPSNASISRFEFNSESEALVFVRSSSSRTFPVTEGGPDGISGLEGGPDGLGGLEGGPDGLGGLEGGPDGLGGLEGGPGEIGGLRSSQGGPDGIDGLQDGIGGLEGGPGEIGGLRSRQGRPDGRICGFRSQRVVSMIFVFNFVVVIAVTLALLVSLIHDASYKE